MGFSKYIVFRLLDAFFLLSSFILQSVILSQYTVYSRADAGEIHCVNPIFQKLLWLTGDLICAALLLLASFYGFTHVRLRQSQSTIPKPTANFWAYAVEKLPLCYLSWFIYSTFLFIKLCVIYTSDDLKKQMEEAGGEVTFGMQFFQLAIGLTAIVFSMLVEAHHDARRNDPRRNAYLNSVSFGVALEILDTASLLSYLMPTFEHLQVHTSSEETCPATSLTFIILLLSALNLVLPTILLYKLTASRFGETYHVKLEMIYKTLHMLLVNLPFFIVRMYLWKANDREEVIFSLKNLYGIIYFFREIYADYRILKQEKQNSSEIHAHAPTSKNRRAEVRVGASNNAGGEGVEEDAVEMKSLMSVEKSQ